MARLAAFLLTYLLHSTLLLSAAALARVVWGERRLALQEALLRVALVGGFVTAGAQCLFELQPWGGVIALAPPAAAPAPVLSAPSPRTLALASPMTLTPASAASAWGLAHLSPRWPVALAFAWGLLACVGLARVACSAAGLRRLLRGRQALRGGALVERVASLARAMGLRRRVPVSLAPGLSVPLATGLWRGEVCLPERALRELSPDDQGALCAHELAHVARRDPAWILAARLVAAVAPLQPLNHWARRRLHELAECLSDDLAAGVSERPLGLARSLVDVASWTLSDNPLAPVGAVGALGTRSRLAHRVERLMDPARTLERPRRLWLPLCACAVLSTAFLTPVVSGVGAEARAPRPPQAPRAPLPPVALAHVPPAPPTAPAPLAAPLPAEAPQAIEEPEAIDSPEPPEAPAAPRAPSRGEALEIEMERLQQRIDARLAPHQGALQELEAAAERVSAQVAPRHDELERLGREVERAATALAARSLEREKSHAARAAQDQARQQLEQAQQQLHALTDQLRLPLEEIRKLSDQARALAEAARPSDDELKELRRLAQELSQQALVGADEARRLAREAAREHRHRRRAPARVEPSEPK